MKIQMVLMTAVDFFLLLWQFIIADAAQYIFENGLLNVLLFEVLYGFTPYIIAELLGLGLWRCDESDLFGESVAEAYAWSNIRLCLEQNRRDMELIMDYHATQKRIRPRSKTI